MKSERRHELQHNDLADWLTEGYERIVPYKNSILAVTLLVLVGAIAFAFWRGRAATQAIEGWNAIEIPGVILSPSPYQSPQYVELVEKASGTYSGTSAGEWAQILTADSYLFFGENQLMGQKDVGSTNIKRAMDLYNKSLLAVSYPMVRERAMFGIARALESLGDIQKATEAYQALNKEFSKGTYKAVADQRLAQLGTPEAAEFYKKLAEYSPKPKTEKPKEKSAEKLETGPQGKLEKIAPLPENPPEEPAPKSSAAPAASKPSAAATIPSVPLTPLEPAKPLASGVVSKTDSSNTSPEKK